MRLCRGYTLADCVRYNVFLTSIVKKLGHLLHLHADVHPVDDPEYKEHLIASFNLRYQQVMTPLVKLALFMHPCYRQAASKRKPLKKLMEAVSMHFTATESL